LTEIELKRGYLPGGTYGDLYINGRFVCHTVERPWHNNQPNISCIPEGSYKLEKYTSPRFGDCFIVSGGEEHQKVEKFKNSNGNRWGILIHPANVPSQLAGCIAPVTEFSTAFGSEYGGIASRKALRALTQRLCDGGCFKITAKTFYTRSFNILSAS